MARYARCMVDLHIRRARLSDALGIATVHVQAWRESYAHLAAPAALKALDVEQRALRWLAILEDGVTDVWVAEHQNAVIGWATASRGAGVDAPRPLELEGLYVLAEFYGSGVGQQLLDRAVDSLPAYLWMAADNPRAAAFYRRNGFTPDGTAGTHDLVGTSVSIIRLIR